MQMTAERAAFPYGFVKLTLTAPQVLPITQPLGIPKLWPSEVQKAEAGGILEDGKLIQGNLEAGKF